ncbi:zinc finger protein 414 [Lates japonicus]|uniref:Zinc finger protein 414 n=1 Tax=Lates japonicus TaxID=270547 RepID=A0AAD3MR71_LATJO|nr:zinc finger protein 414 [Lates japonicus]
MMASGSTVAPTAENGNAGNKRTPCPLHGCKRVYSDVSALDSHIKDHEIPAQSLPGKILLCSMVGCSGSFPNMQELMEHMRHHHKPNMFFLCESCRTKLRSYRGLLTHLHTCSKVPRGKTKPAELTPPQPAAITNPNVTPVAMDQNPLQLNSVSTPQQLPSQIQNQDGSFPAAVSQPDSTAPPLLGPLFPSHQETSPPQLAPQQLAELLNPLIPRHRPCLLSLSILLQYQPPTLLLGPQQSGKRIKVWPATDASFGSTLKGSTRVCSAATRQPTARR